MTFNKVETQPKKIQFFDSKIVINAQAGNNYSMCLTSEADIYVWGKGDYSKLDVDSYPSIIESIKPKKIEII